MSLTPRQRQIATLVFKEVPTKHIARQTGLTVRTVEQYIQTAAKRLPGDDYPRAKLRKWVQDSGVVFLNLGKARP